MAGIPIIGSSGTTWEVDPNGFKTGRIAIYPVDAAQGRYRLTAISGLMTTIAAGTATAGHIFAWRWGSAAPNIVKVYRINVRFRTIAGFTAAQEIEFAAYRATGYSASHTGGTPIVTTGTELRKDTTDDGGSFLTDARIATTAALTAGTHTLQANPFFADSYAELAAAATVPKGRIDTGYNYQELLHEPLVFRQNEGFIIRNEILMGAGGTVRMFVDMDWIETNTL